MKVKLSEVKKVGPTMANEGEQNNSTNDVLEAQQACRYTDIRFKDTAKQGTHIISEASYN